MEVLDQSVAEHGTPKSIRVENGPEFVSQELDRWANEHGVTPDFSRPGKPTDNAYVESFNGRLREECLNANWFLSLEDGLMVPACLEDWLGNTRGDRILFRNAVNRIAMIKTDYLNQLLMLHWDARPDGVKRVFFGGHTRPGPLQKA